MESLPVELILKITALLHYSDLLHCIQLNKWWNSACGTPDAWKWHCTKFTIEPATKSEFISKWKLYGNRMDLFGKVNHLSKRLRKWLEDNDLELILDTLLPPAPIEILKHVPDTGSVAELFLFYHLFSAGQHSGDSPLFGFAEVYNTQISMFLQPVSNVIRIMESKKSLHISFAGPILRRIPAGMLIQNDVVYLSDAESNLYEKGSFVNFLETYVTRLENGWFDVAHQTISLFPNYGPTHSTGPVCHGVQVSVSSIPVPFFSLVHAYRIQIRFDPDAQDRFPSCQLISRFWDIENMDGERKVVEGPGVVGYYPVFSDQQTFFSYASQTEASKSMRGFFTFQGSTGLGFRVTIPEFKFEQPINDTT
jgi:F-box protein 3